MAKNKQKVRFVRIRGKIVPIKPKRDQGKYVAGAGMGAGAVAGGYASKGGYHKAKSLLKGRKHKFHLGVGIRANEMLKMDKTNGRLAHSVSRSFSRSNKYGKSSLGQAAKARALLPKAGKWGAVSVGLLAAGGLINQLMNRKRKK